MPPPQIFSLDGHAYGLTVAGVQVIGKVPTDIAPIRWEMSGEAQTGGISFTLQDDGSIALPLGHVVDLTDNVNGTLLASGVLLNRRQRRSGPYRYVDVDVAGWGWYLDHRFIWDDWGYVIQTNGTISAFDMVHNAFRRYGGPIISDPDTIEDGVTVSGWPSADSTVVAVSQSSIRTVLNTVDTEWNDRYSSSDPPQVYKHYVDEHRRLHYYGSTEPGSVVGTAPCRIGDGSYISDVLSTAGLVEYWPIDSNTDPDRGALAGNDVAWNYVVSPASQAGSFGFRDNTIGVMNEPSYAPLLLGTAGGYAGGGAVVSASIPGTTFSIEAWFRIADGTAVRTLYAGEATDSPVLTMGTAGALTLQTAAGTVQATTSASYDDDRWHHVVGFHTAGAGGTIYVDDSVAGASTAVVAFAAPGTVYIGAGNSSYGDKWEGYLQHVSVYDAAIGTATIRSHYRQGITYAPEAYSHETAGDGFVGAWYVYYDEGPALGWVTYGSDISGPVPYWDAGVPHGIFTNPSTVVSTPKNAFSNAYSYAPIVSSSFTVMDLNGWRPGQTLYVKDDVLTGGEWEVQYIKSVSGELGEGNVVTYSITTGARSRSLVQTVAAP